MARGSLGRGPLLTLQMCAFFFFGMINTLPVPFSPTCQFLDVSKSSFDPSISIQWHKGKMSTYLVPKAINHSFSFKLDLSDFSILFHVWMSNFRTGRLVKSELPHSGFLAFAQKEKPIVANCLCDSFVAGTDEKDFFSLKTFVRSWTIMVGNNPPESETGKMQKNLILDLFCH